MAASVSSLGPPSIGPGNSAACEGFTVRAAARAGACFSRESLSGNTLCHKNNVERKHAIHENRLASVKASLSLSTPLRLDFMDKRLSKNYHASRWRARVVNQNLKLLRALEEIHSRGGGRLGDGSRSAGIVPSAKGGSKRARSTTPGGGNGDERGIVERGTVCKSHSQKLNILLARKRDVQAALVARENQKMMKRMAHSKSLYSLDKMRKHRRKHERILRLRKTDYTAGHLLATTTATRWTGGAPGDDGFSYSFEANRRSHSAKKLPRTSRSAQERHTAYFRRKSHSPSEVRGDAGAANRRFSSGATSPFGVRSAPRLPSLLFEAGDIYGGGHKLTCPDLQRQAGRGMRTSAGEATERVGGGGDDGDNYQSSGNSRGPGKNSNNSKGGDTDHKAAGKNSTFATAGTTPAVAHSSSNSENNEHERRRESVHGSTEANGLVGDNDRGGRLKGTRSSLRSRGNILNIGSSGGGNKEKRSSTTGSGVGSNGGVRGSTESLDSLRRSSCSTAGGGRRGSLQGAGTSGGGGRGRGRGALTTGKSWAGNRGACRSRYYSGHGDDGNSPEGDRIFNPLAFPDEREGVRVLIQATKPLEVLNHVGETWICFIRVMARDPFDGQLDVRIIHDREEVCKKVLSLEEARTICEAAEKQTIEKINISATRCPGDGDSDRPDSAVPTEVARARSRGPQVLSPLLVNLDKVEGQALVTARHRVSAAVARPCGTERDGELNEALRRLFADVDVEGKGYLTHEQVISVMSHAELGLTGTELQLVIAEGDENADGYIDYYEFVPMAYNLVHALRARRRASAELQDERLDLDQQEPEEVLRSSDPCPLDVQAVPVTCDDEFDRNTRQVIHAIYDAEFDRSIRQLKELCRSFDPGETGVIPRSDFKQCISSHRVGGLTKIEAKLLLNLMPKDPSGNVIYRKLTAGMEQVRFATLRNTAAEAAATETYKYLMDLCREEDAKSDQPGNKPSYTKNTVAGGDAGGGGAVGTIGGKQYSGFLRARQLIKLLLNAPLLSLSRLHVTAVMSQAHVVDGMVNYVDSVPMMAKIIEGIFHPRSLKMRHDLLKMRGGGAGGNGSQQLGGGAGGVGPAATVLGKTRDDIQKAFDTALGDGKDGNDIDRLKDPATFANCMTSLDLGLDSDTIHALWETADLDNRDRTTLVDVVDFCFNCVLFLEREKQAKTLQRKISNPAPVSLRGSLYSRGGAAAASETRGEPPAEKLDPLWGLARALVRHAKVVSAEGGQIALEFIDGSQIIHDSDSSGNDTGDHVDPSNLRDKPRGLSDDDAACGGGSGRPDASDQTGQQSSGAGDVTVLARTRRLVPIVGFAGQSMIVAIKAEPAPAPATTVRDAGSKVGEQEEKLRRERRSSLRSSARDEDAALGETRDMVIQVYWEGTARDRVYVEASPPTKKKGDPQRRGGGGGGEHRGSSIGSQRRCLRLRVRVPTLAIVDGQAAKKFAERVAQEVVIQVSVGDGTESGISTMALRLVGFDANATVVGKKP